MNPGRFLHLHSIFEELLYSFDSVSKWLTEKPDKNEKVKIEIDGVVTEIRRDLIDEELNKKLKLVNNLV